MINDDAGSAPFSPKYPLELILASSVPPTERPSRLELATEMDVGLIQTEDSEMAVEVGS